MGSRRWRQQRLPVKGQLYLVDFVLSLTGFHVDVGNWSKTVRGPKGARQSPAWLVARQSRSAWAQYGKEGKA